MKKKTAAQIAEHIIQKCADDEVAMGALGGSLLGSGAGVAAGHVGGLAKMEQGREIAKRIGLDTKKARFRDFSLAARKLKDPREISALYSLLRRYLVHNRTARQGWQPFFSKRPQMTVRRIRGGVKGGIAGLGLGALAGGLYEGLSK
jgi:hypothetical protein